MTHERDFFLPEQVDEQVDQLSPDITVTRLPLKLKVGKASQVEERLVGDLQGYYQAEQEQDLASLKRAWQHVSSHLAANQERSRTTDQLSSPEILRFSHERTHTMLNRVPERPGEGKFARRLNLLAAALVTTLLVGSMFVIFKMAAHPTTAAHQLNHARTANVLTPTPPTVQTVPSSPGLYLITQASNNGNSQVTKVDKNTGKVLWNHFIGTRESPTIVVDNIVFGASGDQQAYGGVNAPDDHSYVYALNAKNGSQIWRTDLARGVLATPTFADGVIYVNSDAGKVYALNAASGAIIWATDVHVLGSGLNQSLAVANGVVYGAMFNKLYALNAQNGREVWSVRADAGAGYSFGSPTVAGGKVYLSLTPPSTHTDINPAHSYIVAYSADRGTQLWKSAGYYWAGFLNYAPVVVNGLVYVANFYTGIYALDSQTGHVRWQHVLGTDAFTNSDGCTWPVVANGVAYANCDTYKHPTLYAYNAINGNVIWSRASAADPADSSNGIIYGTAFPGLVYFVRTSNGLAFFHQAYGLLSKDKFGDLRAPEPDLTLVP